MISSVVRKFATSAIRREGLQGGIPGQTLPFRIDNPYRTTLVFFAFFGSASWLPFLMLKFQLQK